MLRIAFVTNLVSPYQLALCQRIAAIADIYLHVIFCCRQQSSRPWNMPPLDFEHTFLQEPFVTMNGRYMQNSFDVFACLRRISPDVVVTNGFESTHLYAFLYTLLHKVAHVPMADVTDTTERRVNPIDRMLRRFVYTKSAAFLAASDAGRKLFDIYAISPERVHRSCLCADNDRFKLALSTAVKQHDFIFSGPLESIKNPSFALEVAIEVAKRMQRKISILFVGTGSQEERLREAAALQANHVDATFSGYVTQEELPALFCSARMLLLPTRWDSWGIAANEACAAGLPVLISPAAGAANELIIDGENGFVCGFNVNLWAERATMLLTQSNIYQRFSERSLSIINGYTFEKASEGFVDACRRALGISERNQGKMTQSSRPRVVVVERQLLHYRVAVYQKLRELLDKEGVELQLLIGEGTAAEKKKCDEASLDWAIKIPTQYFLGNRICWQPYGAYAKAADLVIVMHENKMIYNLWLLSFGRPKRLAFWGHGRNMQSDQPNGLKERFKRWTTNKVDWWFAYTEGSATLVADTGFPRACITVVDNAVDTNEMAALCRDISQQECQQLRRKLGMSSGPVGLYIGSLYREKRLDFLLDAAQRIRARIPDFQLLIVGAGPDQEMIEQAAKTHAWIHYLGHLQGREKAKTLALADVMLNPGLVGLGVLDSFVSSSPMFTTDCNLHSPEIAYVNSGENGMITADDVETYTEAVVSTLQDPSKLAKLQQGAHSAASRYTVENMVDRLCNGILSCLATPGTSSKRVDMRFDVAPELYGKKR